VDGPGAPGTVTLAVPELSLAGRAGLGILGDRRGVPLSRMVDGSGPPLT